MNREEHGRYLANAAYKEAKRQKYQGMRRRDMNSRVRELEESIIIE